MPASTVNVEFFDAIKEQIGSIVNCDDLQELTDQIMTVITDQLNGIASQMESLLPLQGLLELPTDPSEIIGYLGTLVDALISPLIEPFFVYQQQVVAILAVVQEITDLLIQKSTALGGCGGGITIPSLPDVDIDLGGIIGGTPSNPTGNIASQILGFASSLNSTVASITQANNLITQLQQRITDIENAPANIPTLTSDPSSPTNGQAWIKKGFVAPIGTLDFYIGALPILYDADVYDFALSVQTPDGIKRVSMT